MNYQPLHCTKLFSPTTIMDTLPILRT